MSCSHIMFPCRIPSPLSRLSSLSFHLPSPSVFQKHKNASGETPLCSACKAGDRELVQLLLEHGAEVEGPDASRHPEVTALCLAVQSGDLDTVQLLLRHGADPHRPLKVSGGGACR